MRDSPLGSFSLTVTDAAATPRLRQRALTFSPWGWEESASDGELGAQVRVFTLRRNVFAIVASFTTGASPLKVEARIEGVLPAADGSAQTMTYDLIVLDNAEGRPFGVAFGSTASPVAVSSSGGKSYAASARFEVVGNQQLGLLVAFDADPQKAGSLVSAPPADPAKWHEPIAADWAAYLASGTKAHLSSPLQQRADENAKALLRMNQLSDEGGRVLGGMPSKTHYNHFWVWDSAFHALAVSEYSPLDARAHLDALFRAQLGSGDEAGMIPNHVDEAGGAEPIGLPGYADLYSQAPAFGLSLRPVFERTTRSEDDRAWLKRMYDGSGLFIDWWFRRRDKDGDGMPEVNGGWEDGADNSPRFTEIWGDSIVARLPALESDPRPRLNAVDIAAFLYVYEVEQARIAEALGELEQAAAWRDRARAFAEKIEADGSFWDPERGGYYDYVRGASGRQRFVKANTPVTWFPLFAGTTKDPARVERLVATITDPAKFWGPHGIPSVAFDDATFDAHEYWRGPVWLNYGYLTAIALYRYGYDDEAQALKQRLLETSTRPDGHWEYYDSKTGEGINAYQYGWSGALYMELLRDRHQAEAFDVSRAQPALSREGFIQRLTRLSDGQDLVLIEAVGTSQLPRSVITSEQPLFTGAPVTLSFADPWATLGTGELQLRLPSFQRAKLELGSADGAVTTSEFRAGEVITAKVGQRLVVSDYRFGGDADGCACGASGPGSLLGVAAFVLARLGRKRSRRAS